MQMPIFAIRWASAEPMREAAKNVDTRIGEWAAEFYVITIKGSMGMRPLGGPEQHPDTEHGKRMSASLQEATTLKAKGKSAIHPARVQVIQSQTGQEFAFLFTRSPAISADE
jgi:hypothetical protein